MNEKEKKLIAHWLRHNKVKVCPPNYGMPSIYEPTIKLSENSMQKTIIPKDIDFRKE